MRVFSLLLVVLVFVDAAFAEEADVPGAESYKVNNILKRKDLGNPSRDEVVAALLEADGNAGKAAVLLRKKCSQTEEGCFPDLERMEKEDEEAAQAAQAESNERAGQRKADRKKMKCDVCQTVATVLDERIREELPLNEQVETGFRLLPDGTRRVDRMLKVQTELYFAEMISGVCSDNFCSSIPNLVRRDNCVEERKRYTQACETLVQEYDAELHASVREWPREKLHNGTFVTPNFEEEMMHLCSKEIKACKKDKKTKKKGGGKKKGRFQDEL